MRRWWLSWAQPTEDFRPLTDPPHEKVIGWWCSGYDSNDMAILCALVVGRTLAEAQQAVRRSWPEAPGRGRSWRIADERPDGWLPSDRFPLDKKWMNERAGVIMTDPEK